MFKRGSQVHFLSKDHPYTLPFSYVRRDVRMYDNDVCEQMVRNYAGKSGNLGTDFPVFVIVEGKDDDTTVLCVHGMPFDYKETVSQIFIDMARTVNNAIIVYLKN